VGRGAGRGPGENHDPVADLSVDLAAGAPPLKVNFTVGASDPDSGDSVTWTLAFGDSTTAATGSEASKTVAHTFASAGNFTATLTVTDSHQATATKQVPVAVGAAAASPQVFSGKWTTGGPIGCEQVADGDNINQLAPQAEGVDFVTFPVDAATILHGFKVDIKPTTPGAFEVDFYDAAGNNLGYFDNGYVAPAVPGNTIQDVVPDLSATAVFFACGPGGGTFVYTAQVV